MAVFAVDFDGTIVENKYPEMGAVNGEAIEAMYLMKIRGHVIIIWTCRNGKDYQEMLEVLRKYQIPYDVINEHAPHLAVVFGDDARKVFADYYIDDHNVTPWTWRQVKELILTIPPGEFIPGKSGA